MYGDHEKKIGGYGGLGGRVRGSGGKVWEGDPTVRLITNNITFIKESLSLRASLNFFQTVKMVLH